MVLPACARVPNDKAKVANGVPAVARWVLASLGHQRFFRLNELSRLLRTHEAYTVEVLQLGQHVA